MQENLANRRTVAAFPTPVLGSLRWPGRPFLPEGNPCWTFMVKGDTSQFAVLVGHVENGRAHPFEVWVAGNEQPRCLGAVAKTLSADMRTQDRAWLGKKLDALASVTDRATIKMNLGGSDVVSSSYSAALARVVQYRLVKLGVQNLEPGESTPLVDASLKINRGNEGTLSWTAEISNPATGDDFTLFLPEIETVDGIHRPIAVRFAGRYPRELDGLAELLTMDMLIVDVAWIGMKLRKLLDYEEPTGSFFAKAPGSGVSIRYPSIVAYLARLIVYRFVSLGLLTDDGYPVANLGVMVTVKGDSENVLSAA